MLQRLLESTEYTRLDFGTRCKEMGERPSMGSVSDAYHNTMAEGCVASLECERTDSQSWKTFAEARLAIFTWLKSWCNTRRRHSGIGQKSPINFEKEPQEKDTTNIAITTPEYRPPKGCCQLVRQAAFSEWWGSVALSTGKPLE